VKVEEDRIFITDGPVWTSAGMTAGIDVALAMIEKDLGPGIARAVARKLVVYHRRAGGQSQFSALLELEPKSDRIQSALAHAKRNLNKPLTVEQLANAAHLSPRQFSRAFRAETGQSPAKAVENSRRSSPANDGAEPSSDRRHRSANGFRRPRSYASRLPARLRTTTPGNASKRACGASA
jgi:transcriptional regulator GlxA family with amidase domain